MIIWFLNPLGKIMQRKNEIFRVGVIGQRLRNICSKERLNEFQNIFVDFMKLIFQSLYY